VSVKRLDDYFKVKEKEIMLNVRIPEQLKLRIEALSKAKGRSIKEVVMACLNLYLDQENITKKAG
jgi:hypothetical protein